MFMKKLALIAIISALLSGCGTIYQLDDRIQFAPSPVKLIDGRTGEVRKREYLPSLPGHRFGDENFKPDRLNLLAANLNAAFGDQLNGKRVVLKTHDVVVYAPHAFASARTAAAVGALGSLGYSVISLGGTAQDSDFFATRIVIEIDGQSFTGEGIEGFTGLIDLSDARRASKLSVQKATDRLIEVIRNSLR